MSPCRVAFTRIALVQTGLLSNAYLFCMSNSAPTKRSAMSANLQASLDSSFDEHYCIGDCLNINKDKCSTPSQKPCACTLSVKPLNDDATLGCFLICGWGLVRDFNSNVHGPAQARSQ